MADFDGQSALLESSTPEEVLAAGGVSKRRRNLSNKSSVDRIRNAHSKSPKRRAGTPEPEKRYYTDESEKDVSDIEKQRPMEGRSRVLVKTKDKGQSETIKRTRSKERPPLKDTTTETEDDFEIIRQMHKSREQEEEVEEKIKQEAKPKPKDEIKMFEPKELPPLIMAPTELKKRAHPKTLPLQTIVGPEKQENPKTAPRSKSKTRPLHRKVSTSEEEEDLNFAVRGKLTLKPKPQAKEIEKVIKAEPRRKKIVKAKPKVPNKEKASEDQEEAPKTDVSEFEDGFEYKTENEEDFDEPEEISAPPTVQETSPKPWFFQRWFRSNKPQVEETVVEPVEHKIEEGELVFNQIEVEAEESKVKNEPEEEPEPPEEVKQPEQLPETTVKKRWLIFEIVSEWRAYVREHKEEYGKIMRLKNRCIASLLLVMIFCGFGGMIFKFTEGTFESFYKCGVKRVKRDFIDTLWSNSQYMLEEDWKSNARRKLMEFENQLHTAHEAGMTSYSGQKSWSFLNSVVYSLTVITTIGYGHISPATATGRAITIIYAIFGIPMFLILLADFGKLFTRGIKFLWAFVRRLYYTGSCRKVRKTEAVQEVMKGVQLVYDFAKNRRPSQMPAEGEEDLEHQKHLKPPENEMQQVYPETPDTPALSAFEIDDEFNLPISVAITILITYILFGAVIYWTWEEWSFFESFYFVFISMSTIGFGDFVPQHPMYMMASIVYLVFGLALTSMCINVVQEKLSDTFRQASVKIGATIGLNDAEEDGLTVATAPADLADVNPIERSSET